MTDGATYNYRADLAETALPEMLVTIDRFQVPGVIEAEREGVVKRIFIRDGMVVHASSTDRRDSLGAYLVRAGKLTEDQFAATMDARAANGQKRYGEMLIDAGLISPGGIYAAIRKQIEAIVWSLFYWEEGEIRFTIGSFQEPDGIRIQLPMGQVVLQGIKRAPNAKMLALRLGGKNTVFEPTYRLEDLIMLGLDDAEFGLLRRVDGQSTFYEVCTQGPLSPPENARLMYAFYVLRLVRRLHVEPAPAPSAPLLQQVQQAQPVQAPGVAPPAAALEDNKDKSERRGIKIRFKTPGGKFTS